MPHPLRSKLAPALALVLFAACEGVIGAPSADPGGDSPGPSDPTDPGAPPSEPPPPVEDPGRAECQGGYFHLLRRLTPSQYGEMLRRLFPGVDEATFRSLDGPELPEVEFEYENDAVRAGPTPMAVASYHADARTIAHRAVAEAATWSECDVHEEACVRETLPRLGRIAFRRPLEADEEAAFGELVDALLPTQPPEQVLEAGIEALLDHPEFIYFPETGDPDRPVGEGLRALHDHELAHRLALFLWDQPADQELIARLGEPESRTDEGYAALVDEMLDDPRIERGIDRFFSQWMPLGEETWGDSLRAEVFKEPPFGLSGPAVGRAREAVRESALSFLRHVFLEGSLRDLFTERLGFVNDQIAVLFGVAPPMSDPDGEELVPVELPEGQRAGILTHPAVLSSVPENATFPSVLRAVAIMTQVTCEDPGQPNFAQITTASDEAPYPSASRVALEVAHLGSGCGGECHQAIDGIGFPLEVFDRHGFFRTDERFLVITNEDGTMRPCADPDGDGVDNRARRACEVVDIPIDPSGRVLLEAGAEAERTDVADALELAERIGEAERVRACFAEHMYGFALGRTSLTERDRAQVSALADALTSDAPLRGLARTIASSEPFRTVPECVEEEEE